VRDHRATQNRGQDRFAGDARWRCLVRCAAPPRRLEIAVIPHEKADMAGRGPGRFCCCATVAAAFLLAASLDASAQTRGLLAPQEIAPSELAPGTGRPGASIVFPAPLAQPPGSPLAQSAPVVPAGRVALMVGARYGHDAPPIGGGLIWRVYTANPDANGTFRLVKEERTATPTFVLPPGNYVVHASFGLASAAKAVQLHGDTVHEILDIPAGGIRLQGRVNDVHIPAGQIAFEIFPGSQFDTAERRPIAQNVMTGDVVLLPEGTYYIVSTYGDVNSVVRSDVQVQSARLTDIVVTHRAAVITFKLVNDSGGEALANTQWTVSTPDGDVIKESLGAFPRLVLAEGDYHLIARNEGQTCQRDFKVINGVDGEVELSTMHNCEAPAPASAARAGIAPAAPAR
jgi:hypothetical protein